MLTEELRRLKGIERPAAAAAIGRAREHGDISENAEYDAAKERQGMIEARIRVVEDKLARAEVVPTSGPPPDRVRFGVTVVLSDLDSGEEITYRIVGEDEADVSRGLLSAASPVARALMGKAIDEAVRVDVPAGRREYEVRSIRFEA